MSKIVNELFVEWKLDTWANVLEVFGFAGGIISLIVTLIIKSQVDQLKADHQFDKRVNQHLKNLKDHSSILNSLLNNYNGSTILINAEIGKCQIELEDIEKKLNSREARKLKTFRYLIKKKKNKRYKLSTNTPLSRTEKVQTWLNMLTTVDDIWIIYTELGEVIRHVENIKHNRRNAL